MPLAKEDIDYVLNDLRIKLPGASDDGIKQEMWGVIKTFLQDSNSWVEYQKLLVTKNVQTYNVSPRDGGQIIRLIGVRDGNRVPVSAAMPNLGVICVQQPIQVSSIDQPPDNQTTSQTSPWCFGIVKTIQLPGTRDRLPIAPAFVLQVYSEYIIAGVCGRMMMQQGKGWTNLALGKFELQRFRDGIGIARTDTWNQNLFGGQRWVFPQQFATHTQRGYTSTANPWPVERF